ncbi:MAG: EAL domain-containing protein [Lachnospiraceae bacterium]|nr:EAL domain-containing protein [Lachnospiraceae bacterium]
MENHKSKSKENNFTNNIDNISEEERKKALIGLNHECFFEYDIENDIFRISRNSNFSEMDGLKISHGTDRIRRLGRIHEDDIDGFVRYFRSGTMEKYEFRYIKEDGSCIWCLAKGAFIRDNTGKAKVLIGSIEDINQEKVMYQMLVEQALLDPLTKLYSRTKAQSLIESFLRDEGSFGKHALVLVNIKAFSEINRRFGSIFGDGVLVNIAEKLQEAIRKKDIVARAGGDDFLLFMKDVPSPSILERKIQSLLNLIQGMYAGENLCITCNIGVSCFPRDGRNYGTLFRNADCALYKAGKMRGTGYEFYDPAYEGDEYSKRGEYYHEYVVKDYKKNLNGDFSREITDFAVDIMLNSKDVASAIKLILDKVGKYYKCDNVFVLEADDNHVLHTTYAWSGKEGLNYFNAMQSIDLDELPPLESYFDERGIKIISNTNILRNHPGYAPFVNLLNSKALLQCAFYDEGEFRGCVSIGYKKKTHEWIKEEINPLITITKLISVYLLKLKASEKIQNRIERLTNYDSLTGLPTLVKFRKNVEEILQDNPKKEYAIVYLDIDKFKYVNDTLGYDVGDELLRGMAKTVSSNHEDVTLVGRVSADNFVILMPYKNDEQIKMILKKLNEQFTERIKSCSLGKSVYLISGVANISHGQDVMAVIDNANIARKSIKESPDTTCAFYDDKLNEKVLLELDICNSMEVALERGEFQMYLQPKIDLYNDQIAGAEALTRWIRKDGKFMVPDQFIPLFEKNGFIVQLDFYIYECACRTIKEWIDEGLKPVTISVNVSRVHLNNGDFLEKVLELIEYYQTPHEYLEFELTESIFLDNTDMAISTMHELRDKGFKVSIDDFGAGYSSLNLLKDMTSDVLKLDKEFFHRGDMKNEEKIIVSSITNMAKQLKMKVLSEGVETVEQSEFLKTIECDLAQGYLFSKPVPVEDFTILLRRKRQEESEKA